MIHTPVICRNIENRHLRLGTKRIHVRLIVTIPMIVRSSKETDERPRMYSLGMVSYRLPQDGPFLERCMVLWTGHSQLLRASASLVTHGRTVIVCVVVCVGGCSRKLGGWSFALLFLLVACVGCTAWQLVQGVSSGVVYPRCRFEAGYPLLKIFCSCDCHA